MTSQQINCFMTVAACSNFSAAAEQLFLSQSVVSYHIRAMEKELGFPLFSRDTHRVTLTRAGMSFYKSMTILTAEYEAAVEKARQFQFQRPNQLRICFASPSSPTMMGKVITQIYSALPSVEIVLSNRSDHDVLQPLLSGSADILLTYPAFFRENLGLKQKVLQPVWMTCLMNAQNPLANYKELTLDQLKTQTIIFPDLPNARTEFGPIYRWIQKNLGLSIESSPRNIDQAHGLTAAGRGIMFVQSLENEYQQNVDGLVGIPMADIPPTSLIAVWAEGDDNPLVKRFLANL